MGHLFSKKKVGPAYNFKIRPELLGLKFLQILPILPGVGLIFLPEFWFEIIFIDVILVQNNIKKR